MKKLFSKTVAVVLSAACVGSLLTASFDGKPLFIQESIVHAGDITFVDNPGLSFEASTGKLTLSGEIYTSYIREYAYNDDVKSVEAEEGTVLIPNSNGVFLGFKAESIDLSNANTSKITDMSLMFCDCKNLKSLNLSGFNTKNVTGMGGMFENCSSLESLDLSGFDTKNVTNMGYMFEDCSSLESLDLSVFNTQNVKNMSHMFSGCNKLNYLNVSSFDTKKVCDMGAMFENCSSLKQIELNNFNTENVLGMGHMFYGCSGIDDTLDISSFDTKKVNQMNYMFAKCSKLKTIKVSEKWTTDSVLYGLGDLFDDCNKLIGGNGTKFDRWERIDLEYFGACIDSPETPGYLTLKLEEKPCLFEAFINDDLSSRPVPSYGTGTVNSYSTGDLVRVFELKNNWVRISCVDINTEEWIPIEKITKVKPIKAVLLRKTAVKKSTKNLITKQKSFDPLYDLYPNDDDIPITVYPVNNGKWAKISKEENEWIQLADLALIPLDDKNAISEQYQITLTSNQYTRDKLGKRIKIYPKGYTFTVYAEDKGWGRISKEDEPQEWICLSCIKKDDDTSKEDSGEIIPTRDCLVHIPVDEGKITAFATCQKEGEKELKCRNCGNTYTEIIPRTEHKYDYLAIEGNEPTRSKNGFGQKYCTVCGDILGEPTDIPSVDIISSIDANDPLVFNYNGDAVKYGHTMDGSESPIIKYTTVTYNNHEVIELKFNTNYSWSVSAPKYINIHDKDTCQAISSGDKEKEYTLYIWLDTNKYYESVIQGIKNENYSEIVDNPEIIFNIQGENYAYQIDLFNINNMSASTNEFYESMKEYLRTLKCNNHFDAIDYLCGKSLTDGHILVFDYDSEEKNRIAISSSLDDKRNIRIEYLIFDYSIKLSPSNGGKPLLDIELSLLESKGIYVRQAPNTKIINTKNEIKEFGFDIVDRNHETIEKVEGGLVKIIQAGVAYKVTRQTSKCKLSSGKSYGISVVVDEITKYGVQFIMDKIFIDRGAYVTVDEYSFAIDDKCEMIAGSAINVICYDKDLNSNASIVFLLVDSRGQTSDYRCENIGD